ncbi:hypothetical protein [Companilactobacillus kedongensis]|uniref:hypothetical protein n=1 Tax=Companilactobacillus kedongensis TaxID=2486004 RepID=UPI000F7AF6EA|nr:hypothetical protein [Companilactobacillus kedongensis]
MKTEKRDRIYLILLALFIIAGIIALFVYKPLAIISFIAAAISCIAYFWDIVAKHHGYKHKIS